MLHILIGPDEFSLREALKEIEKDVGDQALLAVNTTVLEGQQVTLGELKTVAETVPFMGEKRLIVVRGLLERFETAGRTRRRKKTARNGGQSKEEESRTFTDYLARLPDSATVVLVAGAIKGDNPLLKALSGKASVRSFPFLKEGQLRQWIQQRVKTEGGSISAQAVNLLARLIGSNLWAMSGEINKLVLFTMGCRIEEADVRAAVSRAQEASVFAMVDAILEFKAGVAEQTLQRLLRDGAAPPFLLVMLARQVQMIVRAKELARQRRPRAEIQARLGLPSEFVLSKVFEQANRHPLARLRRVYDKLLETDLAIKTGRYDGELALNILIADLCQQEAGPRAAGRA